MKDDEPWLSLEDLVQIVCEGNVDGELQERLGKVLRTDPRFTRQFAELEAMTAESGAADLWEGLECNQDFDRLLAAPSAWEDPAEVLNLDGREHYEVNYRILLAVADARLAKAADPAPIEALKTRLSGAEERLVEQTVLKIADPLRNLSATTADKVYAEVRRRYCSPAGSGVAACDSEGPLREK